MKPKVKVKWKKKSSIILKAGVKRKKKQMEQTENNQIHSRLQANHNTNYIKCKLSKQMT